MKTKQPQLAYSSLTDTVYIIDARGGRHEITQNFFQIMLLWLLQGDGIPKEGQRFARRLKSEDHHWEIVYGLLNQGETPEGSVATDAP